MKRFSVLIIEDDYKSAKYMVEYFKNESIIAIVALNALEAFDILLKKSFEIIILDINLPDFDGYEVCKRIRESSNIPIICVSAYGSLEHKMKAFKLGSDDYMVKPIIMDELMARIQALLKRTYEIDKLLLNNNMLIYDYEEKKVKINGKVLNFTHTEDKIITYLISRKSQIVSKEDIKEELKINDEKISIEFHIKNIRRKLGDSAKKPKYLKTIYGQGYYLDI